MARPTRAGFIEVDLYSISRGIDGLEAVFNDPKAAPALASYKKDIFDQYLRLRDLTEVMAGLHDD